MKQLLCIYILSFGLVAQANVNPPRMILETGIETKNFVKRHIGDIQQQAAEHAEVDVVYLDDSMTCLSSHSYIPEVGICQLTGNLGEDGTESAFVVIVSEAKPGSRNGRVNIKVMHVSSGNYE
jgi:hypothetical protein